MSLEGFSKRGMELGNNPERINETKNDLSQQYINAIKRLALEKMRNDILFEGNLGAAMRNLSSLGLDISRESMLKDINTEVNKQMMSYDINFDIDTPKPTQINKEIEQLKNDLGSIFASAPTQEQKPISITGAIPRKPAIQSTRHYETPTNNLSQEDKDKAKEESRRRKILRRLYEGKNDIRVSGEDLKIVLSGFSDPKAITPSQIRESTIQAGTGITDINSTTQEMRKDLEPKIEKPKEFDD